MEIVIGVLIGLLCLALIAIVPILQQREANKIKKQYLTLPNRYQQEEQKLQELLFDIDCQKHTDTHFHNTLQ
jgi:hypothetical protein